MAAARWRGRSDLFWLAREVLNYRDIDDAVHYPIRDIVQQFPVPDKSLWGNYDKVTASGCRYLKPFLPLQQLPGGRRRLILDPRGFYKTTINVICHTIQWILNYPDITILIVHGKQELAEDILGEVRGHFMTNKVLHDLYPDYVPAPKDSGNSLKFFVANRTRIQKEPTVGISSPGSVAAGSHYQVIKFTDIVNEQNVLNKEQIQKTITFFGMYRNVLTSPDCWIDVEGTTYDFGDLYSNIIEAESKSKPNDREWRIHVRGAFKKDTGGAPYTFLPEERELRDLVDEHGNKQSWFPAKFPASFLERERKDPTTGEYLFASQRLNNPIDTSENKPFPATLFQKKSRLDMRKVPVAYYTTTVDTAESQNAGNDYSVVLTCGWDSVGRCYVVDARHGKFLPEELIRNVFDVYKRWHPQSIRIEETGYVRGLKTSFRRQEDLTGNYLPFKFIPRDNERSKEERILHTLEPWYKRKEIYFDESLGCLEHFQQELTRFPKGRTDDLIDALADQFIEREWLGRQNARPVDSQQYETYFAEAQKRAFEQKVEGPVVEAIPLPTVGYFDSTGGL